MFENLKKILKDWLFKEELRKLNGLANFQEQAREHVEEARKAYINAYDSYHYANDLLASCLDVGVDVGFKSPSWAVICIKGKPETVRFMQLDNNDAQALRQFLKRFENSNVIFDSPFSKEFYRI